MYVFVTVNELTDENKEQDLGQVPDNLTLGELKNLCMNRVERFLPEGTSHIPRHFWHNDRFAPVSKRLVDLTAGNTVALELRPDHYWVFLPGQTRKEYAIDPEQPVAAVLQRLLNKEGAVCCYDLLPRGGRPLFPEDSLWDQGILPYYGHVPGKQSELVVRRKPMVGVWAVLFLVLAIVAGLGVGYILRGTQL